MKHQRPAPAASSTHAAVVARLSPRTLASGSLTGPCVPSFQGKLLQALDELFPLIDRSLSEERRQNLAQWVAESLRQGFAATPHGEITIRYRPEHGEPLGVHCDVEVAAPSAEELYFAWVAALAPHAAPKDADPVLLDSIHALTLPPHARVLDVGPGVRHALALARYGLRVDAFEPIAGHARLLQSQPSVRIHVDARDALDETTELAASRYDLVLLCDVAGRLGPGELERALAKLGGALKPGGRLMLNAFLCGGGAPDSAFLERAQREFTTCYARPDLERIAARGGLGTMADIEAIPVKAPPPSLELRWVVLAKA